MSNELSVQSLGDAVKDKVRKAMLDAISDDALQGLITQEFNNFFVDGLRDRYGSNPIPSRFKQMVKDEIEKEMRVKILSTVKDKVSTCVEQWDGSHSKIVGALVEELAPAALAGMMKTVAGECIRTMQDKTRY